MEGPANTLTYFIAGYAVILVGLAAYLISLAVRFHNLQQDVEMLEELEKEETKKERVEVQQRQSSQPGLR